jgi:hypothetical protein
METPVTADSRAVRRPKQLFADENIDPIPAASDPYNIDSDSDVSGKLERIPLLQQARNLMLGNGRGQ